MATSELTPQATNPPARTGGALGDVVIRLLTWPLALLDGVMSAVQRVTGVQRMGWVFVMPNLLIFSVFIIVPMLLNVVFAFTGGSSILPQNRAYVGSANIERLMACADYLSPLTCQEDRFWRAAHNTGRFVVFEVVLLVVLSMVTALALNHRIRARGFFRSVFFYPVLLSPVVVALIWKWVLQRNGLINTGLIGLGATPINFLVDRDWSFFWIIVISVWAQMGFYTLILLAGLQAIPADLYEASAMDGASGGRSFWAITLPLWQPTLLVVTVLSVIRAVQMFDLVYVLTGGGPGTATLLLVQYIYQTAFDNRAFGLAAAASLLVATVLLVFTLVQLRLNRVREEAPA